MCLTWVALAKLGHQFTALTEWLKNKPARAKLTHCQHTVTVFVLLICINSLARLMNTQPRLWGLAAVLFGLQLLVAANLGWASPDTRRASERIAFEQAMAELRTGAGPRYRALRAQLNNYPLALYLDYEHALGRLHAMTAQEARQFMAQAAQSPIHNRFLAAYLEHKGGDKHWQSLLGVLDDPPKDERLQCFYFRALRASGRESEAWLGAAALWNVGYSQDEACDPLFQQWLTQGPGA